MTPSREPEPLSDDPELSLTTPRFVAEPVVEDDTPTRHDLFLAKVATAQRVMPHAPEPRGLPDAILTLAKNATQGRVVKKRKRRRRR